MEGDSMQLTVLVMALLLGGGLNVYAFVMLHFGLALERRRHKKASNALLNPAYHAIANNPLKVMRKISSLSGGSNLDKNFKTLQCNLNVADLMILFLYVPIELAITLDRAQQYWTSGALGCKASRFFKVFPFHASSNIVAAIALDRMISVCFLQSNNRLRRTIVLVLASISWVLAALSSAPQLFIFDTLQFWNSSKEFCGPIWQIDRYKLILNLTQEQAYHPDVEKIYSLFHILSIFWIPFLVILFAYVTLIAYICCKKPESRRSSGYWRQDSFSFRSLSLTSTTKFWRTASTSFKTCMKLVVAYVGFWLPYNLITLLGISIFSWLYYLWFLVLMNSTVNPILYRCVQLPSLPIGRKTLCKESKTEAVSHELLTIENKAAIVYRKPSALRQSTKVTEANVIEDHVNTTEYDTFV